jgi:hypothetical protein
MTQQLYGIEAQFPFLKREDRMKATLLDEQGAEITEVRSHCGRSPGQMVVDWATRPDALFRYYFDRGRRTVILVNGAERHPVILDTRWLMGTRFWFLRTFDPIPTAPLAPRAGSAAGARTMGHSRRGVAEVELAVTHASEPYGVPA